MSPKVTRTALKKTGQSDVEQQQQQSNILPQTAAHAGMNGDGRAIQESNSPRLRPASATTPKQQQQQQQQQQQHGRGKNVSILDAYPSAARRRAMIAAAYGSPPPKVLHPFSARKAPPTVNSTAQDDNVRAMAAFRARPLSAFAHVSTIASPGANPQETTFEWEAAPKPKYLVGRNDATAVNRAAPSAFTVPDLGHTYDTKRLLTKEDLIAAKASELGNHVVPGAPTARLIGSTWKMIEDSSSGAVGYVNQGEVPSSHQKKKDLTYGDLARTRDATLGQHVVAGSANARLVGGTWRLVPNAIKSKPAFTE